MQVKLVREFNGYGCRFTGNLAVVDYAEDILRNGQSKRDLPELTEARKLVAEQHTIVSELLSIPVLVCEVK